MKFLRWIFVAGSAALLLAAGCGGDKAETGAAVDRDTSAAVTDIAREAPSNAKVILENDFVRVAEFRLAPGDSLPPHFGRNRAVYALSDFRTRFTADGVGRIVDNVEGAVHWHHAQEHSIKNVGETEARYVVAERKGSRLLEAPVRGEEQDISHVAPEHSRVLLENDFVRVAEFELEPGTELPSHQGTSRVLYSLTESHLRFVSDRFGVDEQHLTAGDARWQDLDTHTVANIGDAKAAYLIFEWKK